MATNPLAPEPVTDIDGPDVFPLIEPAEDLGTGARVPEDIETGDERPGAGELVPA
jgi:hypothetical protein